MFLRIKKYLVINLDKIEQVVIKDGKLKFFTGIDVERFEVELNEESAEFILAGLYGFKMYDNKMADQLQDMISDYLIENC